MADTSNRIDYSPERNCLTCEHEPDWGAWCGGELKRRAGECKYDVIGKVQHLIPSCHHLQMYPVKIYDDNSGLPYGCPTWKAKNA